MASRALDIPYFAPLPLAYLCVSQRVDLQAHRDSVHPASRRKSTGSSDNQVLEHHLDQPYNKEFAHNHRLASVTGATNHHLATSNAGSAEIAIDVGFLRGFVIFRC